jgi:hypothetical protein
VCVPLKRRDQVFGLFFDNPEEGNQILVNIIQDFNVTGWLAKQDPGGPSKWLDITGVFW